MKKITARQLKEDLHDILDEILETGNPIEVIWRGKVLRITPVEVADKLGKMVLRPEVIKGDPDDLVEIKW